MTASFTSSQATGQGEETFDEETGSPKIQLEAANRRFSGAKPLEHSYGKSQRATNLQRAHSTSDSPEEKIANWLSNKQVVQSLKSSPTEVLLYCTSRHEISEEVVLVVGPCFLQRSSHGEPGVVLNPDTCNKLQNRTARKINCRMVEGSRPRPETPG